MSAPASPIKIELTKDLARHLRAGHPWVYGRALDKPPAGLAAGSIVDVVERGRFVVRGYYDPLSPIAVRVLTRDPAEAISPLFFRKKIARAVALRRSFAPFTVPTPGDETDCCRLIHGEGDGLPGVIVDLYGKFAVLKLYSAGLVPHRGAIIEALRGEVPLDGIYGRDEGGAEVLSDDEEDSDDEGDSKRPEKGHLLFGAEPPDPIVVREHGMQIAVDVRRGQKTGFFLDQREHRLQLGRVSKDCRVLNVFGYTHERQMERGLIDWYEKLVTDLMPWISPDSIERLTAIAAAPMDIRGYGLVKLQAVAKVQKQVGEMVDRLKSPPQESRAA